MNENMNETAQLHGRLVIIGLCLLDAQLRRQLEKQDVLSDLIGELHEPLDKILTQRGRMLYELPESVPNWDDNAMDDPKEDQLDRADFADYLFARISLLPKESEAYAMHLYGPWGSGKSTVLNFLSRKLKISGEWLVVDYNAWQNQHIDPPWWSLMDCIFQSLKKQNPEQSKQIPEHSNWVERYRRQMKIYQWKMKMYGWQMREYLWRFGTGHMPYIIGIIVLFWIIVIIAAVLPYGSKKPEYDILAFLGEKFHNLGDILAVIATIWGFVIAANRSLLLGSSEAARTYVRLTSDPMLKIKEHIEKSIRGLEPKRLAILIDDLDRCQSGYVIELLEVIQTIFRKVNVLIVVVADRRWLNACYEQSYKGLNTQIREPGKPLGALFLEKAFRFSTPVPGYPEDLKKKLWRHLLQVKPEKIAETSADHDVASEVSEAPSEAELIMAMRNKEGRSVSDQRKIRKKAVVRLAAPEVEERLEHFLMPYSEFLEANPRAMKRLVNSYSANRALDLLSETGVDQHQLALWTIVQSRWPLLTEKLEKNSRLIEMIGLKESQQDMPDDLKALYKDLPDDLKNLFEDAEVARVFSGGSFNKPLLETTISQCAKIHGC